METISLPEPEYKKSLERLRNLVEKTDSNVVLVFHRHLDHAAIPEENEELYRLTNKDLPYAKDIAALMGETDLSVAFTVNNLRSYLTSYFILNPQKIFNLNQSEQLDAYKLSKEKRGKIVDLTKKISYRNPGNTEFSKALDEAFKAAKSLEFQVKESDSFREKGEDISSYSLIASEVSKIILKYLQIKKKWGDLSATKYDHKNLFRTFCAREFIYACFRAKLTEKVLGLEERERYISYFAKTRGIKFIGLVTFLKDGKVVLEDDFGTLIFDSAPLEKIIEEEPTLEYKES
jgi:hypothetical protein